MKFALINDDESWFWIWNVDDNQWECWYEFGDQPAVRAPKMDRIETTSVLHIIKAIACGLSKLDEPRYTTV